MNRPEVEAFCERGRDALKQRDHAEANDAFESALAADPDCTEAYEGLATVSYLDGDFVGAIKHYSKLTLLKPSEGRYHTNIGAIYNRLGEHQKACDALRKAIQRDKKCAESYYNLGIAQRKLKQNAMAVSAYKEAIKLNPAMAEAYQNLGNTYVEMGNLQMAIVNFKKALELKPNFEKARNGLETAEAQFQQNKKSINPFGRLVDANSQAAKAAPSAGRVLNEQERWEERAIVKQLAEEIEHLGKGCLEYLKQKLEPAVMDVERATAQGADAAFTLPEASENFRDAVNQWGALRRSLKRKVLELRAHEEFINTPEIKL
ncbi:MAG: tetratricopeptide repeat protein [Candidatus Saccharimonas sp.]|nr:tetratricopeptide repeat protein [Planctomycetaceae bacterium]